MIELIILPILVLVIWLIVRKTGLPDPASLSDDGLAARRALEQAWLQEHAPDSGDDNGTPRLTSAARYEQRCAYLAQLNAEWVARQQIDRH